MSEALPIPSEAPVVPAAPQWDPFQLMDRMDEEALRRELDGVAATDLVYVVKEGGQEVVGLSKTGVDECCMALVSQGQVIREENLQCELLEFADGRDYLAWMAENFGEPELRDFVRRILGGEEVVAQRGRQLNPHWYEAGAMKAARNARFRLIPGNVRAQVIASARQSGLARVVEAQAGTLRGVSKAAPVAAQAAPTAATAARSAAPPP